MHTKTSTRRKQMINFLLRIRRQLEKDRRKFGDNYGMAADIQIEKCYWKLINKVVEHTT